MSADLRVSIIVPTHNRAGLLAEAIESVLAQTYHDWELIVVDDGSTDQTEQVMAEFQQRDQRIRYIRQTKQGVSKARNAGIRVAQGLYIAFLDSDDVWFKEKLTTQMEVFEQRPDVGLVSSTMQVIDEQKRICGMKPKIGAYDRSGHVEHYAWETSTVVIRRDCLPGDEPFDPMLAILEDHDLYVRICQHHQEVFLPEPAGLYRAHSGNTVADTLKVQRGYVTYYEKVLREYDLNPAARRSATRELARRSYFLGKEYYNQKRYQEAVKPFVRALRLYPLLGQMFFVSADSWWVCGWKLIKPWGAVLVAMVHAAGPRRRSATAAGANHARTVLYLETGSGYGGSAQSLLQLLKGIDRHRVAPVVVAYAEGSAIEQIRSLGIPVKAWGTASPRTEGYLRLFISWWTRELPRLARLLDVMRSEHVEVVHLNNDIYSSVAGIVAAVVLRTPCIGFLRLTRPPTRMERWLGRGIGVKLVLTREAETFYRRWWPKARFVCVFDGVELPVLSAARASGLREAFKIPAQQRVVGLIARCVPGKGYGEFLQAAQLVRAKRQDVTFVILGNGRGGDANFEEEMHRFAQTLNLNGSLVWGGWQTDTEAVYGLLDVVLQASSTFPEGLSRIPLEAMAHGRPVIATDIVGNREAVVHGETGLLVPPGDAAALAEAIMKLLQEPALASAYGRAGRTRAETVFSVQAYTKRIEGLYEQLR